MVESFSDELNLHGILDLFFFLSLERKIQKHHILWNLTLQCQIFMSSVNPTFKKSKQYRLCFSKAFKYVFYKKIAKRNHLILMESRWVHWQRLCLMSSCVLHLLRLSNRFSRRFSSSRCSSNWTQIHRRSRSVQQQGCTRGRSLLHQSAGLHKVPHRFLRANAHFFHGRSSKLLCTAPSTG